MEEEKKRKQEELNKLKQMKREEILEKLKKAEFISGAHLLQDKRLLEKAEKELKTEFIPELYDKAMEKMFDEKYYGHDDKKDGKVAKKKDIDIKLMKDEDVNEEMKSEDTHEYEGESNDEDEMDTE